VPEPGWNLYAAAVFNDHNPWFPVMPDVVKYMHRVSWLLRQGKPASDVAILLPEDDAQADFTPGHVSVTDEMKRRISPALMSSILDAGYNLDYLDAATIDKLGQVPYPIVVLPPTDRIPTSTYKLLAAYVAKGGHVIGLANLPSLAPGLGHQAEDAAVTALTRQIFHGTSGIALADLPIALHKALPPDLGSTSMPVPAAAAGDANSGLGFIHRRLSGSDIYFVVNSSSAPLSTTLFFHAPHNQAVALSLDSGTPLGRHFGNDPLHVTLPPYQSIVFVLYEGASGATRGKAKVEPAHGSKEDEKMRELHGAIDQEIGDDRLPLAAGATSAPANCLTPAPTRTSGSLGDLDRTWTIALPGSAPEPLRRFTSWANLPNRTFFSGEVIYSSSLHLNLVPTPTDRLLLDFGVGTPIQDNRPPGAAGIHALLDPPIRDAAIILVNGTRVGSLWHPPYQVNLSPSLHKGDNTIEVHVYNTAVNSLAGQPARDYTALNAKFGKRFDPQDMNRIESLPSGLLVAPNLRDGSGRPVCIETP